MKKFFLLFAASLLALSLTACGGKAPAQETPAGPDSAEILPLDEEGAAEDAQEEASSEIPEPVYVADAALYRGSVTAVETAEEGALLTLEQAPGTNFGAPSMKFLFTSDTRLSFEEEKLAQGAYLEIYYGAGSEKSQPVPAIGANFYPAADMVNFNGALKAIMENPDKPGEGRLAMVEAGTGQEVHFNYDKNGGTQFYLDFDALQPGDELNIFHRGAYTRSLPPQGFALEVRPYAQPETSSAAQTAQ